MSVTGPNPITLCAVGDLSLGDSPKMLGIGVRSATCRRGGEHLFAAVGGALEGDIVFGNLEGILSDAGYDPYSFHAAQLRGLPSMAQVLGKAGVNVVSVANNHMMQYGAEPFLETCRLLEQFGIAVVGLKGRDGWNCKPVVLTVKGKRIGLLGYADPDNYGHEPLFALNLSEHVIADALELRKEVDTLVVSLHWGEEFVRAPSPKLRSYGRRLVDLGVDVVLGHHPHVIQPIEQHSSGYVCYSLGNFISDMVWNPRTREGLLVRFDLSGTKPLLAGIRQVEITGDFVPFSGATTLAGLQAHVAEDEVAARTEAGYRALVHSRIRENTSLGHFYLLRNAWRINPLMYLQIWLNSFGLLRPLMRFARCFGRLSTPAGR